jgi:hypothetical protein
MRMASDAVWRQAGESLVRDDDRAMAERIVAMLGTSP